VERKKPIVSLEDLSLPEDISYTKKSHNTINYPRAVNPQYQCEVLCCVHYPNTVSSEISQFKDTYSIHYRVMVFSFLKVHYNYLEAEISFLYQVLWIVLTFRRHF